jgi:hypothetical protein
MFGRNRGPDLKLDEFESMVAEAVAGVATRSPSPLRLIRGSYRVSCRVQEREGHLYVVEDQGGTELEHEFEFRVPGDEEG